MFVNPRVREKFHTIETRYIRIHVQNLVFFFVDIYIRLIFSYQDTKYLTLITYSLSKSDQLSKSLLAYLQKKKIIHKSVSCIRKVGFLLTG